jgi:hypothetical protein
MYLAVKPVTKKLDDLDEDEVILLFLYLTFVRHLLLDICYFYISQMKSSLDKIYKVVYHHIIYMCDFLVNLDNFFCRGLHEFSRKL